MPSRERAVPGNSRNIRLGMMLAAPQFNEGVVVGSVCFCEGLQQDQSADGVYNN